MFYGRLSPAFRGELDWLRKAWRQEQVTWRQIVEHATDAESGASSAQTLAPAPPPGPAPAHPVQPSSHPTHAPPAYPGPPAAPTARAPTAPARRTGGQAGAPAPGGGCWICHALGAPKPEGHSADRCFANPQSADFQPAVRTRRLAAIKRAGKEVPPAYLALGEGARAVGHVADFELAEQQLLASSVPASACEAFIEEWINA